MKKSLKQLSAFHYSLSLHGILSLGVIALMVSACSSNNEGIKDEQIRIDTLESDLQDTSNSNSIRDNLSLTQISSVPSTVVLTGLSQHRLVTVYKSNVNGSTGNRSFSWRKSSYYEEVDNEREEHFMPGIDLIHGYNLLNVAHYDMVNEKLDFLFEHPVLIKSLYYPSFEPDSLYKKPINRDYYLVSVYDADTNLDTLINKKDLRKMYYFNAPNNNRIQLLPADYSVVKSQYDPKNDAMFIFAKHDSNNNGAVDKKEPLHIFWISLKNPAKAKRLY